jgi:hypothetical protein
MGVEPIGILIKRVVCNRKTGWEISGITQTKEEDKFKAFVKKDF